MKTSIDVSTKNMEGLKALGKMGDTYASLWHGNTIKKEAEEGKA